MSQVKCPDRNATYCHLCPRNWIKSRKDCQYSDNVCRQRLIFGRFSYRVPLQNPPTDFPPTVHTYTHICTRVCVCARMRPWQSLIRSALTVPPMQSAPIACRRPWSNKRRQRQAVKFCRRLAFSVAPYREYHRAEKTPRRGEKFSRSGVAVLAVSASAVLAPIFYPCEPFLLSTIWEYTRKYKIR